ncbi:unnamed protein product, partial [Polarella glacialis]
FAPVPLGIWAERRGEREVYYGLALLSAIAAAALAVEIPSPIFALAWAALSVPPAVRGVRAAYFAKHVAPEDLSRAGQLASSAGLTGGFLGPLASGALTQVFGDASDDGRWPTPFLAGAIFSATASLAFTLALAWTIPKEAKKKGGNRYSCEGREWCERCSRELNETELGYATALCDNCYDSFRGAGYSFGRFCRNVLIAFCVVAALLEVSMNAGVIAAFQPIAVSHFGWGSDSVAAVNFAGAAFSVVISLLMAHLRLPERTQMAIAAGLYLSGVLVFTTPPLSQWRLVVGLMLGIKAQILFMAPFTAIFSRLIGRARVTNRLTTALCLAPAIGAALGTAFAPVCIDAAGTPAFALVALPAVAAVIIIAAGWNRMQEHMPGVSGVVFRQPSRMGRPRSSSSSDGGA